MRFVKMQGTGNDFLLIETKDEPRDWSALAQAMCERHFGVGADGLILVMPSDRADVRMRLFNADGSEAEVSGNGVRCLVKYAVERGPARPADAIVRVETAAGLLEAEALMARPDATSGRDVARVRLSMGEPRFAPADVPVRSDMEPPVVDMPLEVAGRTLSLTCLSMGNPHAVQFIETPVAEYPLHELGPHVEHHPTFPARVNFGVARMLGRERMELRVWERGVGETLACGSGSSAALVASRIKGLAESIVDITQPGGDLTVEWSGRGEVRLSGPAEFVFEGDWPDARSGPL